LDFPIPVLSGPLTGATLTLDNPFQSGSDTYTVYSLGAFGTYASSDIGTGTEYGNVGISGAGPVTITLNAAALTAIEAAQGGTFSLGGLISAENVDYDFGFDPSASKTILTLDVAVPEPSTFIIWSLLGGLGVTLVWRRGQKSNH
jgi:hypothetical protein